jgi:DNA mismatch endonuclease (patch repair protein)
MAISRSENMSRIRSQNSLIERRVRSILHRRGYRFRCAVKGLPGKPDIVFARERVVAFVHGCFWHMHRGCCRSNIPNSNQPYWHDKLHGNVRRDARNKRALENQGYMVVILWGCDIEKNPTVCAEAVIDTVTYRRGESFS